MPAMCCSVAWDARTRWLPTAGSSISIRTRMPHASIGSDVMAGFPGETDADHAINMRDLAEAGLTALHVFPYSDRPGTVSSRMSQKVAGGVTRERARALRMVSADLARRFRESLVGTVRRMLTVDTGTVAVTDNYLKVRIPAGHERNQWIAVRIDAVDPVTTGGVIGEGVHPLTAVPVIARRSHVNDATSRRSSEPRVRGRPDAASTSRPWKATEPRRPRGDPAAGLRGRDLRERGGGSRMFDQINPAVHGSNRRHNAAVASAFSAAVIAD